MTALTHPSSQSLDGLSSAQAAERLARYGANAITLTRQNPWLGLINKFWAPVPWMLELTILLEIYLGKHVEAIVIGALLVFNAILSLSQEGRAQAALNLLRRQLSIQARVKRDGNWQMAPARDLVPGDIIHLRMGDLIPADLRILEGVIEMDQAALTGESAPVEAGPGQPAYSGAIIKRGEATGEVNLTGDRTSYGKTAELVLKAKPASHLAEIIFSIVRYLVMADAILVALVILYAIFARIGWNEILPFAIIILVASVPVALPATFTLATALGAAELSQQGVLVTRLAAIEEAAAMTVLASDKTGTITENRLKLNAVLPFSPYQEEDVIRWATLVSESATQDPLDLAILQAAHERKIGPAGLTLLQFVPFEPATKRSEAVARMGNGDRMRVMKGAVHTLVELTGQHQAEEDVSKLAAKGNRVLAVAVGSESGPLQMVGLLGLQDAPRADSQALVQNLREMGVRVVMVTGDDPLTAKAVAEQVGIPGDPCSAEAIGDVSNAETFRCNIFAGVLPEDKFHLVEGLQDSGHIVGMTGDGVNDAPALKQAEVGIAVANATDVAKAAASLVLTMPGLGNILAAIKTSRRIFQRMLTYTVNKIIKTFQIALFLSLGFIFMRLFGVTPLLIILLLFANDFVTMSISTDNVSYSLKPDHWNIRSLVVAAFAMALPVLLLSFGFLIAGNNVLHLPLAQLQTWMFVMLVFTGQANVYLVRERRHFWKSRPSRWMLVGTLADIILVSIMATQGLLMAAIPIALAAAALMVVLLFIPLADWWKIFVFKVLGMD